MKNIILAFIAFAVSSSCFAENKVGNPSVQFQDLPAEKVAQINEYAETTIKLIQKNYKVEFGYDEKSVYFLSNIISKDGKQYSSSPQVEEKFQTLYGSYLGVAIIKKYGGKWIEFNGNVGVMVTPSDVSFPFNKVIKHIENGESDSILALYLNANNMKALMQNVKK